MSKNSKITSSNFRALFQNELGAWVKFAITSLAFLFGVLAPYYQVRQDIALIQQSIRTIETNHLAHVQDLAQIQKEQGQAILEMQKQIWQLIK
jgi:hypothetical protein